MKGSRSGTHGGRLHYYSTHTGGSFLPAHPFTPGETVTVTATSSATRTVTLGTKFTVSSPYTLPAPQRKPAIAETSTNVMRFHSRGISSRRRSA